MHTIKIEKLVYNGYGIARFNGKVVFVDSVLPEEEVVIEVLKEKKTHSFGKLIEVLTPSKHRIEPKCSKFYSCGGCQWQHIDYTFQLECKKNILLESFKNIAKIESIPDITTIPSFQYNYRNRVKFQIKDKKIGFYKKLSHEFIEIDKCHILSNEINEFIKEIKIDNYLRELEIFSSSKGEILSNLNKRGVIYEHIGENRFKISQNSFFQINKFLTEKLMNIVLENSHNYNKFADLFSGVGLFAIPLAKVIPRGIAIEASKFSYKDSVDNLKLNNVKSLKLYRKKVENSCSIINKFGPDIVILDPPRTGITKNTAVFLNELKKLKKIIYVSCNPITLSRDLNILKSKFQLQKLFLIDMFPNTYHIETVSILIKK